MKGAGPQEVQPEHRGPEKRLPERRRAGNGAGLETAQGWKRRRAGNSARLETAQGPKSARLVRARARREVLGVEMIMSEVEWLRSYVGGVVGSRHATPRPERPRRRRAICGRHQPIDRWLATAAVTARRADAKVGPI